MRWQDAWVETKCTLEELEAAGVRPGTRMVIGKHRKRPLRLKDYIASYALDNKASVAILLEEVWSCTSSGLFRLSYSKYPWLRDCPFGRYYSLH